MNKEALEGVRNRWLAASSGPWALRDLRTREGDRCALARDGKTLLPFVRKPMSEEEIGIVLNNCPIIHTTNPKRLRIAENTIDKRTLAAMEAARSEHQNAGSVEEQVDEWDARQYVEENEREEWEYPAFAVLTREYTQGREPGCQSADINFVLHAPEDVGALLDGIDKAHDEIADLRQQLEAARKQVGELKILNDRATDVVASMKRAAKALLDLP